MASCVAYGCTNTFAKKIPGVTFHRFPKAEKLRKEWINAIRRKDWAPSQASRLCSAHFPEHMIDRTSLSCVRLRENAVPTIFKTFPSYLQKKCNSRKSLVTQSFITSSESEAEDHVIVQMIHTIESPEETQEVSKVSHQKSFYKNQAQQLKKESGSDSEDTSLPPIKSENSTILRSFPSTNLPSEAILLTTSKSDNIPLTITKSASPITMKSADIHLKNMKLDNSSTMAFASGEILLKTIASDYPFLAANNLENAQENNLVESHCEVMQKQFLNTIFEPKISKASEQISCVTHVEAFCATETLLRYLMNQDDVSKTDINFILNLAKRIKDRLPIKKEVTSGNL